VTPRSRALLTLAAGLLVAGGALTVAAGPTARPAPATPSAPGAPSVAPAHHPSAARGGRATGVFSSGTPDSAAVRAFLQVVRVLKSPRCQNCHPAGDAPLQTDAGIPHAMLVTRGPDGRGVTAMKCAACHQRTNNPAPHGPPGAPNWHLPPAAAPMVIEGRTPSQICRQMKDPAQNGGKSMEELFHHLTADSLVLWGWNPGPGRTLPPLSQPAFARQVKIWYGGGNPCPREEQRP
jgi:hypothetical protein